MPNIDAHKGMAKEAAGDLTVVEDLHREGKVDQATGTVKDKVGDAADKVKDVLDRQLRRPIAYRNAALKGRPSSRPGQS